MSSSNGGEGFDGLVVYDLWFGWGNIGGDGELIKGII